jgi:hypothetical protein
VRSEISSTVAVAIGHSLSWTIESG